MINKIVKQTQNLNILYVEDNIEVRENILLLFEDFFNKIFIASDGLEAIELFIKNKKNIDLIVTDIEMPNLNGIELSEKIRKLDKFIPILILTAYDDNKYLNQSINNNIDGYLLKPIDMRQFFDVMKKVLGKISKHKKTINYNQKLKKVVKEKELELENFKVSIITIFTHELRTPLNAIVNFSSYINKNIDNLSPKKQNKIKLLSNRIYSNGIILLDMVENLLEIAKLKSNSLKIDKKEYILSDIIINIIKNYQQIYNKKVFYEVEDIKVIIDKKIFSVIFMNIFSNALKYSNSQIFVSLKKDNNYSFILTIEDDGNGIKDSDKEKIFYLFEQNDVQNVLLRENKGTGLGLYIVKEFANICNFEIIIEDSKFGGAKFIIRK